MLGYGSMEAESESEPVGESVGVVFAQACAPSRPRGRANCFKCSALLLLAIHLSVPNINGFTFSVY